MVELSEMIKSINDTIYFMIHKRIRKAYYNQVRINSFKDKVIDKSWFYCLLVVVGLVGAIDPYFDRQPLLFMVMKVYFYSSLIHVLIAGLRAYREVKELEADINELGLHSRVVEIVDEFKLQWKELDKQNYRLKKFEISTNKIILHNKQLDHYKSVSLNDYLSETKKIS